MGLERKQGGHFSVQLPEVMLLSQPFSGGSRNPKYKSNPIRRKHHLSWVHGEPDPFDHCEGSGQFLWSGWEIYRYSSSHERMYVWQTQSCSAPEKYTFPEAFWGNGNPDNIEKSVFEAPSSNCPLSFFCSDPKQHLNNPLGKEASLVLEKPERWRLYPILDTRWH